MVREELTRHLRHDLKSNPESTAFAARKGKEPQGQPVSTEHKDAKQRLVKDDPNINPAVCSVHIAKNDVIEWKLVGKFTVNPKILGSQMLQLLLATTRGGEPFQRILQLWALWLCSYSIQSNSNLLSHKRRLKH